jgi:hypothetical protein
VSECSDIGVRTAILPPCSSETPLLSEVIMVVASPSVVEPGLAAHRRAAAGALVVLGVLAGVLAAVGVTGGAGGTVRAVATVGFLVLGPGWAVAGFLRSVPPALAWTVAVAVGTAVGALGAQAMLAAGWWQPQIALGVLVVVCLPALVRHVLRAR